jgi:hypothetical protein
LEALLWSQQATTMTMSSVHGKFVRVKTLRPEAIPLHLSMDNYKLRFSAHGRRRGDRYILVCTLLICLMLILFSLSVSSSYHVFPAWYEQNVSWNPSNEWNTLVRKKWF